MLFAVLGLFISTSSPAASGRWCTAPQAAAFELTRFREIVTGLGAEADLARHNYGISAAPADSVVLIRDERICERAARAYYRHELGPFPTGGITVMRVLDRYVVSGGIRAGEWTVVGVYSREFARISSILM